jgi:hypothetical protein
MSKITERYKQKQKKGVLGMLKNLAQKIQNNEFEVTNHGFWKSGLDDKYTFRVDVKENKNQEDSDEN